MKKCKKLFEKIDELNEFYLNVWEDVCNIESPSRFKEGLDRCSAYFVKIAEERGWQVEYRRFEEAGDAVCITLNPGAGAAPLALSGHLDTVHPVGSFGTPAVRRDAEKMYGPGVTDCKGGAVAALLAMDALDQCGFRSRPVCLLLQTDEEVGSSLSKRGTIDFMCEKAKDAVGFLNLESHAAGKVCVQRKGIHTFTFTIHGVEAHASNCATIGANAIAEAAHKILELEKIKDDDGVTCCCSVINGGTVSNTVPGLCVLKANVRFATEEQRAWVKKRMQEIADTVYIPGCHTELSYGKGRAAMELTRRNLDLLDKVNAILAENGLRTLEGDARKGGSDAADVTACGIPCLDSLGVRGSWIHSPDEYAYLDSLAESAKMLAAVAYCI